MSNKERQVEVLEEEIKMLKTEQTNRQLEHDRNQQVDIYHITRQYQILYKLSFIN